MGIKEAAKSLEDYLARFRMIIGILVFVMLVVTSILTYQNFDKQNQIIETGGFIDGDIKCVCDQAAWDEFTSREIGLNLSYLKDING